MAEKEALDINLIPAACREFYGNFTQFTGEVLANIARNKPKPEEMGRFTERIRDLDQTMGEELIRLGVVRGVKVEVASTFYTGRDRERKLFNDPVLREFIVQALSGSNGVYLTHMRPLIAAQEIDYNSPGPFVIQRMFLIGR